MTNKSNCCVYRTDTVAPLHASNQQRQSKLLAASLICLNHATMEAALDRVEVALDSDDPKRMLGDVLIRIASGTFHGITVTE